MKHEFTNSRTSIYENKDVRFCFDKKINYTTKEENANDFVSGTTFNISSVNNEEPAWLRAVDENNR